ncbi:SDR family NAD(P)-dependent oxidoreductase [Pseudoflavonifractor phocaeensis]|uniref:SDR family NAD(P)-dependent oxidoreductase n=1 Tax=Pseudoflavonifractor phocaeensis TaxID=1870988 RepID=UPI00210919C5|nr:glucose 1-dehydrogenase [Pseudoflavonifractor phocaeensis]MCQ4863080.1 SDR family oxidoreductase [Pseudoflavonifractor phocaeensis]
MEQFRLQDQVVLITGGGSGLGRGIGQAVAELGAAVVAADVRTDQAEEAAAALRAQGFRAAAVEMDVTRPESIAAGLQAAVKAFGHVDVLVNNAGITRMQDIGDITPRDWEQVFSINVEGMFLCCQQFFSCLRREGRAGRIVNIASNAAKVTFPGQAHYNASKAAVVNMTQSLAKELAPFGINVNAVCPGAVDTEMLRYCMVKTIEESPTDARPTLDDLRASWGPPQLGRLIQPVEVGRVVAFLASDAAGIIRGQSISVDAGSTPF